MELGYMTTWNCDECYSQKQLCFSCAEKAETKNTFNAVVVSREDFENLEEYTHATPEQQDMIWSIAESEIGDMLMQDDHYSECLEYCVNRGLKN